MRPDVVGRKSEVYRTGRPYRFSCVLHRSERDVTGKWRRQRSSRRLSEPAWFVPESHCLCHVGTARGNGMVGCEQGTIDWGRGCLDGTEQQTAEPASTRDGSFK